MRFWRVLKSTLEMARKYESSSHGARLRLLVGGLEDLVASKLPGNKSGVRWFFWNLTNPLIFSWEVIFSMDQTLDEDPTFDGLKDINGVNCRFSMGFSIVRLDGNKTWSDGPV